MAAGNASSTTVGRELELERLVLPLRKLEAPPGTVFLVRGEPGIGKTRLGCEVAEQARRLGRAVAWGRCAEAGTSPPFWPWVQILRALVAAEGTPAVSERLGAMAHDVLRLTAGSDTGAVGVPPPAELMASQRFRLFDGVGSVLAGARRGAVVVLDDAHRADDASLALLRHLTAEIVRLPVLLLVTYRDTELGSRSALLTTLAELAASPWCEEVALGPLDDAGARLLASRVSGSLTDAELDAVVSRGDGNPFFLEQLARAPAADGVTSPVLTSVRVLIRCRVDRLPEPCQALLEVLAVAGREAAVSHVAAVSGLRRAQLLAALGPAVTAGLLVVSDRSRLVQFSHALVQEVVYEELEPDRRARLHEQFARRLAEQDAVDMEISTAVAEHALRAAWGGRQVDPVPALRAAAQVAATRLAFEEAHRLLELALVECRASEVRLELLLQAGQVLACSGRPAAARARFERAAECAIEIGDVAGTAAAVLGIGSCVVPVGQVDWCLVTALKQAVRRLPETDVSWRPRLLARLAVELYWHDGDDSRRISALALETTGTGDDSVALTEALHARLFTLRGPDRLDERLALGRRLVDLATQEQLDDAELRAHAFWMPELLRCGDLPTYRAGVQRMSRLAARTCQPLHQWYAQLFLAQRALIAGDMAQAATLSSAAADLARRLGTEAGEVYSLAQQLMIRRDTGDVGDLVEPLAAAADRFPALVTIRMLLVLTLAEADRQQEAVAALGPLAASHYAVVPPDSLWTATLCCAAEVAHLVEDAVAAEYAAQLLEPYAGSCAVEGLPVCWGAVDRALGLAWLTLGDVPRALAALRAALELHERWGMPALAARTRLDLATALGRAGAGAGASSSARRYAEEARAHAHGLGLHRLVERAASILSALQGARAPALSGPGGALTPRQHEVLRLIASGSSNRAIAEQLFVSLNTVERHVRNVYLKLDVTNRATATALAVRAGVVLPERPDEAIRNESLSWPPR